MIFETITRPILDTIQDMLIWVGFVVPAEGLKREQEPLMSSYFQENAQDYPGNQQDEHGELVVHDIVDPEKSDSHKVARGNNYNLRKRK